MWEKKASLNGTNLKKLGVTGGDLVLDGDDRVRECEDVLCNAVCLLLHDVPLVLLFPLQ